VVVIKEDKTISSHHLSSTHSTHRLSSLIGFAIKNVRKTDPCTVNTTARVCQSIVGNKGVIQEIETKLYYSNDKK